MYIQHQNIANNTKNRYVCTCTSKSFSYIQFIYIYMYCTVSTCSWDKSNTYVHFSSNHATKIFDSDRRPRYATLLCMLLPQMQKTPKSNIQDAGPKSKNFSIPLASPLNPSNAKPNNATIRQNRAFITIASFSFGTTARRKTAAYLDFRCGVGVNIIRLF